MSFESLKAAINNYNPYALLKAERVECNSLRNQLVLSDKLCKEYQDRITAVLDDNQRLLDRKRKDDAWFNEYRDERASEINKLTVRQTELMRDNYSVASERDELAKKLQSHEQADTEWHRAIAECATERKSLVEKLQSLEQNSTEKIDELEAELARSVSQAVSLAEANKLADAKIAELSEALQASVSKEEETWLKLTKANSKLADALAKIDQLSAPKVVANKTRTRRK